MGKDRADVLAQQWLQEKSSLNNIGAGVTLGRFALIAAILDRRVSENHKYAGLGRGEFDVLACLRRSGEPFELTPTELYKSVMLTSGAMTNRLDRLENKGLIERIASKNDRRSSLVRLSAKGFALIDEFIQSHFDHEAELLASLSAEEQRTLDGILKKWLQGLGDE